MKYARLRSYGLRILGLSVRLIAMLFLLATAFALVSIRIELSLVRISVLLVALIGIPIALLFDVLGTHVFDRGKMALQIDAETLMRQDTRPPVLYLRSFRNAGANSAQIPLLKYAFHSTTDEEHLAMVMSQVGPFVALGEPIREGKPIEKEDMDFGAARVIVNDEGWQDAVIALMSKARLVVLRLDPMREGWGSFYRDSHRHRLEKGGLSLNESPQPDDFIPTKVSKSVGWEIEQLKELQIKAERILLYLPFKAKRSEREAIYNDVRHFVEKRLGRNLPDQIHKERFIGFRPNGTAYFLGGNGLPSIGIINSLGRTLNPFFQQLGNYSIKTRIDYFGAVELGFGIVTSLLFSLAFVLFIYRLFADLLLNLLLRKG